MKTTHTVPAALVSELLAAQSQCDRSRAVLEATCRTALIALGVPGTITAVDPSTTSIVVDTADPLSSPDAPPAPHMRSGATAPA